jgi:hypothetical protein
MAKKSRRTKDLAQRIDPTYFRDWHPLRRNRFFVSAGFVLAAVLWISLALARGDERLYANGPVAESHRMIEEDCERCHTRPFAPVPDAACRTCHTAIGNHVPAGQGEDPACATCHADHKGRLGLARVGIAHCDECHDEHAGIRSLATHVEFKPVPREQHLAFSHKRHLDPALVDGPLDCISCHRPLAGSRDFTPVSFADHCARCHEERIDAEFVEPVPHGLQVPGLRRWVAAALLERMRETGTTRESENPVPGRGAGVAPSWTEELEERTERALAALLPEGQARGCLLCHVASHDVIRVPQIPANWLPRARFDHRSHATDACAGCHDMSANDRSGQLSLPGVEKCRSCHNEHGAPATCFTCHPYHPVSDGGWR